MGRDTPERAELTGSRRAIIPSACGHRAVHELVHVDANAFRLLPSDEQQARWAALRGVILRCSLYCRPDVEGVAWAVAAAHRRTTQAAITVAVPPAVATSADAAYLDELDLGWAFASQSDPVDAS